MPTRVRSHAKINLGLGIGAARADGFHGLSTVYQTLEMYDVVTVTARPATATSWIRDEVSHPNDDEAAVRMGHPAATELRLTSNDSRVPCDESNTAWNMVALALEALGMTARVEIHIEKHLPVQGGLGAGSANAVAALIALEHELGISVDDSWKASRLEIAAKVGSDVPLFLIGGTVLGFDRGQRVAALPDLEPVWAVIVAPDTGVSTRQAFCDWDALCLAEGLTDEASTDKLYKLSHAYLSAFGISEGVGQGSSGVLAVGEDLAGPARSELVRTGITSWIQNDFERVVFSRHPSLAEIKHLLAAVDTPEAALYASLSGSGSALFGLYISRGDAEAAVHRLNRQNVKARSTVTRTLPRSEYWREMILD